MGALAASCAPVAQHTQVLLGHPGAFEVAEVHNPHMADASGALQRVDREHAILQWESLKRSYESIGVQTAVLDAQPGLPDLCFSANPSFVLSLPNGEQEVWLAKMRHPSRAGEVEHHRNYFESLGLDMREMPDSVDSFEGCGDGLLHPGRFLLHAGVGPRSSGSAWDALQAAHPSLRILRYRLVDPRFYHLDTALVPLNEEVALYVPEAFDDEGTEQVRQAFPEAVELPLDESLQFAGNAHCPDGAHVLIDAACTATIARLNEMGFAAHAVDTSEFRKSGGSVFCLKQSF